MTKISVLLLQGKSLSAAREIVNNQIKEEAKAIEQKIVYRATMYNRDYSERWNIVVRKVNNFRFEVWERDWEKSLFDNPLASGITQETALQNFYLIEDDLINSL